MAQREEDYKLTEHKIRETQSIW